MQKVIDFIDENGITSVLDIGANVGRYSHAIKYCFPNIDIFMIEANPWCDNHLNRVGIPYKIACLSDEKKEVKLFFNRNNMVCTGVSYYQENTVHYSLEDFIKTETKLLDEVILEKFGDQKIFEFIKMDTQGSEMDIIKGGVKTFEQAKHIQIEMTLIEYNKGAPLKDDVSKFLNGLGFKQNFLVESLYKNHDSSTGIVIQEDWIFSR
jgi:FkbM family methyltransferase